MRCCSTSRLLDHLPLPTIRHQRVLAGQFAHDGLALGAPLPVPAGATGGDNRHEDTYQLLTPILRQLDDLNAPRLPFQQRFERAEPAALPASRHQRHAVLELTPKRWAYALSFITVW